jgi:hypothetical protein
MKWFSSVSKKNGNSPLKNIYPMLCDQGIKDETKRALRLLDGIDEYLEIADSLCDRDTKLASLENARELLVQVNSLKSTYPYLAIDSLLNIESKIDQAIIELYSFKKLEK